MHNYQGIIAEPQPRNPTTSATVPTAFTVGFPPTDQQDSEQTISHNPSILLRHYHYDGRIIMLYTEEYGKNKVVALIYCQI